MLQTLAVHGYRSLRDVALPLGRLTVITGANGTGKSSLYRAFGLLADAARGRLVASLALAGGLTSVLWAGPEFVSGAMRRGEVAVQGTGRRKAPISLGLGFATDELGYLIDVGLPQLGSATMFFRDPEIKRELVFGSPELRPAALLVERNRSTVKVRQDSWVDLGWRLPPHAGLLDELSDPVAYPDIAAVRAEVLSWRFYDTFRVDAHAPARQSVVGTRTEVLAADGSDLPAAVQTVLESAWAVPFAEAVADAFDGARVEVAEASGRFELQMRQPGMLRELAASEWSDGTLRYVLMATALLSPRPPGLLVLNEPETSLHPDVLPALGRLILEASKRTQVVVVTHNATLVRALDGPGTEAHELVKELGETRVADQGLLTRPRWNWGAR